MPRSPKDCDIIYANIDDFFGHTDASRPSMPEEVPLPKALPVYDSFCELASKHAPIAITVTAPPTWKYKNRLYAKRQVDNQWKTLSQVIIDAIQDTVKDTQDDISYYVFPELHQNGNVHAHGTLYFENTEPHPYYCRKIVDKLKRYGLGQRMNYKGEVIGLQCEYIKYPSKWYDYCRKDYGKHPLRPKNGQLFSFKEAKPTQRSPKGDACN